jgi:hypothetical protein
MPRCIFDILAQARFAFNQRADDRSALFIVELEFQFVVLSPEEVASVCGSQYKRFIALAYYCSPEFCLFLPTNRRTPTQTGLGG